MVFVLRLENQPIKLLDFMFRAWFLCSEHWAKIMLETWNPAILKLCSVLGAQKSWVTVMSLKFAWLVRLMFYYCFVVPLGVCDPNALEQQNFFQNMNPGQRGSIFAPPPPDPPTSDCKYAVVLKNICTFLLWSYVLINCHSNCYA